MDATTKIKSTYSEREARMDSLCSSWGLDRLHDLMGRYNPSKKELTELRFAVMLYISKAFYFDFTQDEEEFLRRLNDSKNVNDNVTPNGAIVPKKEYQLELNMVLRAWTRILKGMVKDKSLINAYNICPNIRIKFSEEVEENKDRTLNTAWPHSDAWLAGPWGINCHTPLFGDIDNNNLKFWKPIDKNKFTDEWIKTSKTYEEMQWVLDYYIADDSMLPKKGHVHLSDYALIHGTWRRPNAGTRVSMDTTIFAGTNRVETHEERAEEYLQDMKVVGEDMFISTNRSLTEDIIKKKSNFAHYASGTLQLTNL